MHNFTDKQRSEIERLHRMTGQDFESCLFCLRFHQWHFQKALNSMARPRENSTEGDRCKESLVGYTCVL